MLQRLKTGGTLLILAVSLLAGACTNDPENGSGKTAKTVGFPDFHYTNADVSDSETTASARLPVDIYLDATLSMKGFSRPQSTNFSSLLEGIEATVQNASKSSDLRYYKYGRSVAAIPRAAFVAARHSQELWEDKGFRSETDFAQAVDSTDPGRVSIFITDLFYSNADANKVVAAIQDKCFKNGVELGMMGLKSDYDGYVADVQPPVKVTGSRPFYLLVFGSKANIELIFSAFRNQPYVQANQALLLTRHPVKSFRVEATKARDSRAINPSSVRSRYKDLGNVFAYNWNPDKGDQGAVDYTLSYQPEPYTLPIAAGNLKAHVFRKEGVGKGPAARDSVADAQSLSLQPGPAGQDKLTGKAVASLKLPEDGYVAYQITWQYDNLSKVELPTWVTANSTADFNQASPAADKLKTLALDNFVRSLVVSSATQFEPKYGRMYVIFNRK